MHARMVLSGGMKTRPCRRSVHCAHLLDEGWEKPRCVQSCPTGALRIVHVKDSEMQRIIESENLEVLHPEYNTRPRVYYKNLYRYTTCFIAGSVAVTVDGITDCVQGATVTLIKDSIKIEDVSDNYGDFKFDDLKENSGNYTLEIVCEGYKKKTLEVDLTASINAGTIFLTL